jgi:hypothetical protein
MKAVARISQNASSGRRRRRTRRPLIHDGGEFLGPPFGEDLL